MEAGSRALKRPRPLTHLSHASVVAGSSWAQQSLVNPNSTTQSKDRAKADRVSTGARRMAKSSPSALGKRC